MSLFLVNRYLGDEDDGCASKQSRSQALLVQLQQKAKEKQQQKDTTTKVPKRTVDVDPTEEDPVDQDTRKKRGEKKRRRTKEPDPPVTGTAAHEATGGDAEAAPVSAAPARQDAPAPPHFTPLGGFDHKAVHKVTRVLPQWLSQPDAVHSDIKSNLVPVSDVPGLCPHLVKKLQKNQIQHLFPVQAEVIPVVLEGARQGLLIGRGGYKPRDVCVSAPTGSGKTLAFVIPVVQVLMERVVCEVRALAVLPTKELAQQVWRVFTTYADGTPLKVVMLAGHKSFSAEQASLWEQRGRVRRSLADIIVATPGRLVDHIQKGSGLRLEHLRFLIIDEADRMIDSMHQSWLSQVVQAVYRSGAEPEPGSIFRRTEPTHITAASLSPPPMPLQKLLFSATLTQNPEKLQQLGLHQPRLFSSTHRRTEADTPTGPPQIPDRYDFPQGLTEYYVHCTLSKKPLLILHFLLRMKFSPMLCFTNSREAAHRLFLLVQLFGGVRVAQFSSRLSPAERKKTLKDFERGKIQLLVSTDAAARGIDINGVKCVVNYDAPQYIRTYIHRIGRTARAGKAGLAFTFLLGVQEKHFLQMVAAAGSPGIHKQMVKAESLKGMEERYQETLQQLQEAVREEKAK